VQRLAADAKTATFADASQDLRWTIAIAAYAETVKQSAYGVPDKLSDLRGVFAEQAERDVERGEFLQLFDRAATLLP
jgi:hypothetical protein